MNRIQVSRLFLLLGCLLVSTALFAADNRASFDFDAKLGYHNDSNVGIADLDTNSGSADAARTYGIALKAALPVTRRLVSRFGYDYEDTAYQELSAFDLGLHHVFAELTWKTSLLDAGINVEKFQAQLDGDNYLDLVQVTPSVSRLIGNRVFLRGAYTQADKQYADLPGRDATSDAFRADLYMLIDNMDRYIAVGLQNSEEDTVDPAFDYDALRWNMTYGHTFALASRDMKLKASVSHEGRTYANQDEAIGDNRQDKRLRFRIGANWQVFEHFGVTANIEHLDIRSNLESAALDKTIVGLGINATF
tara:strand:- start:6265 stop:7182 length:918 start_codon:yes stop_codon:yes gene_type:complete